jgi:hypothetical protein
MNNRSEKNEQLQDSVSQWKKERKKKENEDEESYSK